VLDNPDPSRAYIFTNPNDAETGTEYYKALPGARVETLSADGPRLRGGGGISEGAAITRMGQVLVSYPLEYKQDEQRAVEAKALAFDRAVIKTGTIKDHMRGGGMAGIRDVGVDRNETEWAMPRSAQGD